MAEAASDATAGVRRSRLQDERGRPVPVSRALRNGPRALVSGIARKAFGRHGPVPWISYDARRVLERHLTRESRVLEFGSGMSTLWYARRAESVLSFETWAPWHEKISEALARERIENVDYRYCPGFAGYPDAAAEDPARRFDLIMIDGPRRDACVRVAAGLLAPGGILYLDNADKGAGGHSGDVPLAAKMALSMADERGLAATYFTDFAPGQFFVETGLMIHPEDVP